MVLREREGVKIPTLNPIKGPQRTDCCSEIFGGICDKHQILPL